MSHFISREVAHGTYCPSTAARERLEAEDAQRSDELAARCGLKSWRQRTGNGRPPRLCKGCGGVIGPDRHNQATYCSNECRRALELIDRKDRRRG